MSMPVYLDCCATTPVELEVQSVLMQYLQEDFGNAGSRTHVYGSKALQAVQKSRDQIAKVVAAKRDEVIFTSGATESNNLTILGLLKAATASGRKHIITSSIEHKAILEPLELAGSMGFEVTYLPASEQGYVQAVQIHEALREDTFLVTIMHVNNETGIVQPIEEIATALGKHDAWFHVDAAQGFGKAITPLQNQRIDFISISGHKIFAPKGVGALIARRRGYKRPPLEPLMLGGGQERGLRPGTLPVFLIAALGKAAERAHQNHEERSESCLAFKKCLLKELGAAEPVLVGDQSRCLPNVVNLRFPGINSEALMVGLKDLIAISNGSACTSSSYTPSHVLKNMGLSDEEVMESVRISWCHMTPDVDWGAVKERIASLR